MTISLGQVAILIITRKLLVFNLLHNQIKHKTINHYFAFIFLTAINLLILKRFSMIYVDYSIEHLYSTWFELKILFDKVKFFK